KSVPFTHSMELYIQLSNKYPGSRVFLDIFDGGHELRMEDAKRWFLSQINDNNNTEGDNKSNNRSCLTK
ncbi:MAG TPA: hypothetical protein PK733_18445, partial [Clostridiales bacterium]|nr:hypothetical protein [Clostridiales bacterium]